MQFWTTALCGRAAGDRRCRLVGCIHGGMRQGWSAFSSATGRLPPPHSRQSGRLGFVVRIPPLRPKNQVKPIKYLVVSGYFVKSGENVRNVSVIDGRR